MKIEHIKWIIRIYLPIFVFFFLCGLILFLFIYLLNIFKIGDSLSSTWDYVFTWGLLVLIYFTVGIAYLYWYVKRIIVPMYPNDLKQQRRTLHIAGLGLYVTCLVCFIGFIVSTYLDDMSFVSFFIGLLGTFIGSILFLALGPRFLKSLGDRNLEFDERSERT